MSFRLSHQTPFIGGATSLRELTIVHFRTVALIIAVAYLSAMVGMIDRLPVVTQIGRAWRIQVIKEPPVGGIR